MEITIAVLILAAGIIAEGFIFNHARERAERESILIARLARYAGWPTK